MREKILGYKNAHADEPVCIIANGSSAAKIDWAKCPALKMGLNRAWQLTECDYYVMGDMGQFATFVRERGNLKQLSPLFTLGDGPEHAIRITELHSKHRRISFDLTKGVYPNNTVTAFGIQLALWMGCNPIYIAGLDCKGSHFWGGSDVPADVWARQREIFGYIAGILEPTHQGEEYSSREIYNLNPDSACTAFEFGELP